MVTQISNLNISYPRNSVSQRLSFTANNIDKDKNSSKSSDKVWATLACLGAAGIGLLYLYKGKNKVKTHNIPLSQTREMPLQNASEHVEQLLPKFNAKDFDSSLVCQEIPIGDYTYSYLKSNPKGFYLEFGQLVNEFLRTGKLKPVVTIENDLSESLRGILESQNKEAQILNRSIIDSIDMLDNQMTSKTVGEMTVYRYAPQSWLNSAKDGVISDSAFLSTSTEPGASLEGIIGSNASQNKLFVIHLKKDTPFCDFTYTSEKEMLLPRNCQFKIQPDGSLMQI